MFEQGNAVAAGTSEAPAPDFIAYGWDPNPPYLARPFFVVPMTDDGEQTAPHGWYEWGSQARRGALRLARELQSPAKAAPLDVHWLDDFGPSGEPVSESRGYEDFAVFQHSSGPAGGYVVRSRTDGTAAAPYRDAEPVRVSRDAAACQRWADSLNGPTGRGL